MGKARAETVIARPADVIWERVCDFGDLSWYPGVESCTLSGDDRIVRRIGMKLDIVERQLDHDHEGRTYGYRLTDLNGESQLRRGDGEVIDVAELVGHVRATLTVIPADEATSRVTYDVEAPDQFLDGIRHGYQEAVDHLKGLLEHDGEGS
jgi:carbon monoxide dehydrogenase subunit G